MNQSHPHWIGGRWIGGGASRANINPSDVDEVVGYYADGGADEVAQAAAAAREAAPGWRRLNAQARADLLDAAGDRLIGRSAELGELLAREEGKTRIEAEAEFKRAGQVFKFFAGEAMRGIGEVLPSVRAGVEVLATREPLGVVGLITPWNFPIAIPAWKAAPALAYGNTVVLKPSELTPASAWALARILEEVGFPPGVFNLVMGGRAAGEAIAATPGIDAVSFTGSQAVGRQVAVACAGALRRFQLEMGGKNPLVVLADADLDLAVEASLNGAFYSTGQRCTASSRLIVEEAVHEAFVGKLVARLAALKVGPALEPDTQIGPVVSQAQAEKVQDYVAIGRAEGATVAFGGDPMTPGAKGWFLGPTLFSDVDNSMRIAREEIFGPVAAVIAARDAEHALRLANDTEFGLSAAVFTTSLKSARLFRQELEAGMVMVNLPTAGVELQAPFGGTKGSSFGPREQGGQAREFYTRTKTAYIHA